MTKKPNKLGKKAIIDGILEIPDGAIIEGALAIERWLRRDDDEMIGMSVQSLAGYVYSTMQRAIERHEISEGKREQKRSRPTPSRKR